jgi:hypothetical protein
VGIPIEPYNSDETRVTVTDVLLHCIGKRLDQLNQNDRNQVARCLIHAGWKRRKAGKGPERGKWFYLRPDVPSVPSMYPVLYPVVSE